MEILQTQTHIGLIREKNEDVVSSVKHPRNKNIKLLIAADGMGGRELGDVALINKKKTLVLNTGDSRTYIYRKNKLIQVTEDDSDVWMYHKYGGVKKDHLRFFSNNNIISACIGICNELCTINSYIIENDYQMLLLFTDGVTDNITDKKIKKVIRTSKKEDILSRIIEEAVYIDQHLHVPFYLRHKYLANYIVPYCGRDNASGVIYIKDE